MNPNNFNHPRIYRSRNGAILGVCRGIAEHFAIPVLWLRLGMIIFAFPTGFWPVILIYFVLAFYLKPEPVIPLTNDGENEFYDSYTSSSSMALNRLKRKFDNLSERIHRMEDVVTGKDFRWQQDFKANNGQQEYRNH